MSYPSKIIANKRMLVANRGEIAIRIFRAATELNLRTIAIYSEEDRFAMHRFKADEAYKLGEPGKPVDAYLNWQNIIDLAKRENIDGIHPGYGFLSEDADFARACEAEDIMFVGPPSRILDMFGDKLAAKKVAIESGIPVIPGTREPVETLDEAKAFAAEAGYPVTLKAQSGGGGKGIRTVTSEQDLSGAFERARSEAQSSFGKSHVYMEKTIVSPKHIEVQIAADCHGTVVHLYERDCSIQRRHQKVIEIAPAISISEETRTKLHDSAVRLAKHVGYVGIGTVEFLVDKKGEPYFLEVNPRIQVEHTVTEMITGYDLVQTSIVLAAGRKLKHPAVGIQDQSSISPRGVAIQCRITTEDPLNQFAPDTGQIVAYRPAQGFGVRLDEGLATSGGIVTPHYDSLLVKLTTHALDFYGARRKMLRSLREFRIRGVKHNIPLLINIIGHKAFDNADADTSFLETHPDVFQFKPPKDRATKLLKFIGNVTLNNPHDLPNKTAPEFLDIPDLSPFPLPDLRRKTAKEVFDEGGPNALSKWILQQNETLLTDTTMRDAHQSLFATRLRSHDIYKVAEFYREMTASLFSIEVWGGATFDTCLRFLKEDPWERLENIRKLIPNVLLQMLLRGDNAVGYTNYPSWVLRDFIRLTVQSGLDVFRIFDCLNNPAQMAVAIDEVKKQGAIAEACVCYTGNIIDPTRTKYDLPYYIKIAKELESMGADILCIKDMAGLLRPDAAAVLIKALKNEVQIPLHLHTHATSGNAEATVLSAALAGCDVVDGAVSAMSGLTSQPSLNALVAALQFKDEKPAIDLRVLDELSRYWESVRSLYQAFDPGIKSTSTRVYTHEIPGGQYSNLYHQARKVGVSSKDFLDLTDRYRDVNELLGDIVKVTPSSKVVGDFALLLQKHGLSGPEYLKTRPMLDYPDSVMSFFRGHMGVPYGGFNEEVRELVLGKDPPAPCKPEVSEDESLESVRVALAEIIGRHPTERETMSYRLYPKVYLAFQDHENRYGSTAKLPTDVFFYGLQPQQEIEFDLEKGKTLIVRCSSISKVNEKGYRKIFFKLNGFRREIEVRDESSATAHMARPKADTASPLHVPAPMPGKVIEIKVAEGTEVKKGEVLLVTESMKMEYAVTSKVPGKVRSIGVSVGDLVEEGDLLVELC